MHKHQLTPDQQKKINFLCHPGQPDWCPKLAIYLEQLYKEIADLTRERDENHSTAERAAIKLESYAAEFKWLRQDIKQIADQMPDDGQIGMWKQAMLLLTMPPSKRPENKCLPERK